MKAESCFKSTRRRSKFLNAVPYISLKWMDRSIAVIRVMDSIPTAPLPAIGLAPCSPPGSTFNKSGLFTGNTSCSFEKNNTQLFISQVKFNTHNPTSLTSQ